MKGKFQRGLFFFSMLVFIFSSFALKAEEPLIAVLPVQEGDFSWKGFRAREILNGITETMTDQLVNEDGIRVVERTRINEILDEQDFGQSGRVNAETAAQIGKILGVDSLILATLTEMSVGRKGGISIGPISVSGVSAKIVITGRVVDANTAEIMTSYRSEAEEMEASLSVSDLEGLSFDSSAFRNSILGETINSAVTDFTRHLVSNPDILKTSSRVLEGRVASIIGDRVVIDIGSESDVRVRQSGQVIRILHVEGIDEPVALPIGEVEVSSVNPNSAILDITYIEEEIEVGDYIRLETLR